MLLRKCLFYIDPYVNSRTDIEPLRSEPLLLQLKMSNMQFSSWGEQQSLFKLSYADAETCNQLASVVSVKSFDD